MTAAWLTTPTLGRDVGDTWLSRNAVDPYKSGARRPARLAPPAFSMRFQMSRRVECVIAIAALTVSLGWLPAAGADEPGAAERAGKSIDHAAKSTEKALKKAGEKTVEGIETAGKAVQKAGKKTGDAVANAVEKTGEAITHTGEKIKPSPEKK
jgi:hypothetical protein